MRRVWVALLATGLWSGCGCSRSPGLHGSNGELVIVSFEGADEVLSREAVVAVPDVAMDDVGTSLVRLRNVGTGPVTVTEVTREGDEAFALVDATGQVLEAGAELEATVRFSPPQAAEATLAKVEHRAVFHLALGGTQADENTAQLEVVGQALARDCYVPAQLDFGDVAIGLSVQLPFVLENGKGTVSQTTFGALSGPDPALFSLDASGPIEVAPGAKVSVPVWFAPLASVTSHATVMVQRGAACTPVQVELLGRGVATSLTWAPKSLDFGKIPLGSTSLSQVVKVVNGSNATLAISGLSTPSAYQVEGPPSVPPRGTATFTVVCKPTDLGRQDGELAFSLDTRPATSVRVPVRCQGGGPRIQVPTVFSFGEIPRSVAMTTTAVRRLVVRNVGTPPNAPGDPSNNLVLGVGGRPPLVSVLGTTVNSLPTELEVGVPSTYQPIGVPAIAGQNLIELELRLKPASLGLKSFTLSVYSNDALTPVAVVQVGANVIESVPCSGLNVSPAALSFGPLPRGYTETRAIVVKNDGSQTCQLYSADMTPGSAPAFAVGAPASVVILPGASSTVRVAATVPTTAQPDESFRGYVRFFTSDLTLADVKIPVEARAASCLVVSPLTLSWAGTAQGCRSGDQVVTFYNICGVPLTIGNLRIEGSAFRFTSVPTMTNGSFELPPATHLSATVAFVPTLIGGAFGDVAFEVTELGGTRTDTLPLEGKGLKEVHLSETFKQGSGEVDILFVVDDSCSMSDEQVALGRNFNSFIQHATTTGADFRLGVTTTDTFTISGQLQGGYLTPTTPNLNSEFARRAKVGTSGSGLEQPFEALLMAVTPPATTGANRGFLRSGVPLAAVIVTDALEQSPLAVDVYVSKLRAAKGNKADLVNVSVVGPFTLPTGCQLDSNMTDDGRYARILSLTGGAKGDICTSDWARDLDGIGQRVVSLTRTFTLSTPPTPGATVSVAVDGTPRTSGWSYDSNANSLTFSAPPPQGSTITVGYDTVCLPP